MYEVVYYNAMHAVGVERGNHSCCHDDDEPCDDDDADDSQSVMAQIFRRACHLDG